MKNKLHSEVADDVQIKEMKEKNNKLYLGFYGRINEVTSGWFKINSGVKQGCVMYIWIFNLYIDGVMKKLRVRM